MVEKFEKIPDTLRKVGLLIAALLILVVVYFLSPLAFAVLYRMDLYQPSSDSLIHDLYQPASWLQENWQPYNRYISWVWEDQ